MGGADLQIISLPLSLTPAEDRPVLGRRGMPVYSQRNVDLR